MEDELSKKSEGCVKVATTVLFLLVWVFVSPLILKFVWNDVIGDQIAGLPQFSYWGTFWIIQGANILFGKTNNSIYDVMKEEN